MLLNGIKVFAGVTLSGLAVGLPVGLLTKGSKGVPMLKTPSTRGQESLGFQIKSDNPAGGGIGLEVGKTVKFSNNLGIKFGEHILKAGDRLCSGKQDYNFFLMKSNGQGSFDIEGVKGPQILCRDYQPKPKTVKLEGLRNWDAMQGSVSVATIEVSTCSFTLQKIKEDKYKVIISDCWTYPNRRGTRITEASWVADYK